MRRWVVVILAMSLGAWPAAGEAIPSPRLESIFPLGAKAGASVEVTVGGDALEGARQLVFSHPGITAEPVMLPADRFYPNPRPAPDKFTIHVAPEVPPGFYDVRVATRLGVSNVRCFVVSSLPEFVKSKTNTDSKDPLAIAVNSVANGTCEARKDDFYRFSATKGQRLVIHCTARQIYSKTDAVLRLYDGSGKLLDDFHEPATVDPTMPVTLPADGEYIVSVHDYLYEGGAQYGYRLSISSAPWIDFVDPPFAVAGTSAEVTLYGHNLPGSSPADVAPGARPLEKLKASITAPAKANPPVEILMQPVEGSIDSFGYQLVTPGGTSNTCRIALVGGSMQPEQEPNDTPEQAQALTLPAQVLGRFQSRGDRDWFTFNAKKEEKLWIEVISSRLGLPSDPSLLIQHVSKTPEGKTVVRDILDSDDQVHRGDESDRRTTLNIDDPGFLFTAPEDGAYRIMLRDLYGQGNPRMYYLLSIRPQYQDFSLLALSSRVDLESGEMLPFATTLRKGASTLIEVVAIRRGGFEGAIRVTAPSLPPGVTAQPMIIAPGSTLNSLVLEAAPAAPDWTGPIQLVGSATVDGAGISRPVQAFEVYSRPPPQSDRAPMRLVRDLAVAVRDDLPPPLTIKLAPPAPLRTSRGGKLTVPVTFTGTDALKGQVRLDIHGLPKEMRTQPATVDAGSSAKSFEIEVDAACLPGTFTFIVRANPTVSYIRNPQVAAEAEQDQKRIVAMVEQARKSVDQAVQARQQAEQAFQQATQNVAQAEQQRAEAQRAAAAADAATAEAAGKLKLAESAAPGASAAEQASHKTAVDAAAKDSADRVEKAKAAADVLAKATAAKAEMEQKLKAAEAARKQAMDAEAKAREDVPKVDEARRIADERARVCSELARPRDLRMVIPSAPVTVEVLSDPFTLTPAAASITVKAGGDVVGVPVTLARDLGFDDEVRCLLVAPPGAGGIQFVDAQNKIPKGQNGATLQVRADASAPAGSYAYLLRATYLFNGRELALDRPMQIMVTPADKK